MSRKNRDHIIDKLRPRDKSVTTCAVRQADRMHDDSPNYYPVNEAGSDTKIRENDDNCSATRGTHGFCQGSEDHELVLSEPEGQHIMTVKSDIFVIDEEGAIHQQRRTVRARFLRNTWFWIVIVGLVAVLTGLLVCLVLLLPGKSNDQEPQGNTTALLVNHSFDGGAALDDPSSPQYRAMAWLERNANLQSYSDNQKLQRFALAVFYYSTNGAGWRNNRRWLTDAHECTWFNLDYFCSDGMNVSNIFLDFNNLLGFLPSELAFLSNSLAGFSASNNSLSGSIPTEFGHLTSLTRLLLKENDLSNVIPSEIGLLKNLHDLDLDKNDLEGSIPSELGAIGGRREIKLSFNGLRGSIPSEMGQLIHLNEFWVAHNSLVGSIPSEIGQITTLEKFVGLANNLEGLIPSEFGHLKKLRAFTCRSNLFKGPLPSEFGILTNMMWLSVHSNELTGTLPTDLYQLSKLKRLEFYDNNMEPPFVCPESIETCLISCGNKSNESCRSLL